MRRQIRNTFQSDLRISAKGYSGPAVLGVPAICTHALFGPTLAPLR